MNLVIVDSGNGFLPVQLLVITKTGVDYFSIKILGKNSTITLIKIQRFTLKKIHLKMYCQVSYTRRTLEGNKIVDHSDVVGASPVGAAPTTSSFST